MFSRELSTRPYVLLQVTVSVDGTKGSLFDALEDTDAAVCAEKAKRIASLSK